MAYGYTAGANNAASASGTSLTVNFTVSAGDTAIIVYGAFTGLTQTTAYSDGTHTYNRVGTASTVASTLTHRAVTDYVLNPTPGSYTLTQTIGGARANRRVAVITVSGVNAFQSGAGQGQLAAATTTDAVSTSAMTPSSQPAMLASMSITASGTATYTAGTGSTTRGALSNWDSIGSFSSLVEDIRLTSTSAVSGLFTIGTTQDTLSQGLILTETTSSNTAIAPGVGSIAITGYAPTVAQTANQSINPGVGSITITGYAPTVTQASGSQNLAPDVGQIVITGYAPTVEQTVTLPDGGGGARKKKRRELVYATQVQEDARELIAERLNPEPIKAKVTTEAKVDTTKQDDEEAFALLLALL